MFERFTDRARRVLVAAQEEARGLNHNFIGTEHILLGLLAEGEGVAAVALNSLGVTLDDMQDAVVRTISRGTDPVVDSPPFTPRSKKVLELSLREALQLGHNYIGTEHILLGLIREGEGVAADILRQAVDLGQVRSAIIELLSGYVTGNRPVGPGEAAVASRSGPRPAMSPGMSPAARRTLELANFWAVARLGRTSSLDLLLALLAVGDSRAARILERAGLTGDAIEALAREVGVEGTTDELPDEAIARNVSVVYDDHSVTIRIDDPSIAERLVAATGAEQGGSISGLPSLAELAHAVVRIVESFRWPGDEAFEPIDPPVSQEEALLLLESVARARIEAAAAGTTKIELTAHELDVLEGLAAGVAIEDLSAFMGISVEQAESIARNATTKIDVVVEAGLPEPLPASASEPVTEPAAAAEEQTSTPGAGSEESPPEG